MAASVGGNAGQVQVAVVRTTQEVTPIMQNVRTVLTGQAASAGARPTSGQVWPRGVRTT